MLGNHDTQLLSGLLGEVGCIQEILDALERETVSIDDAVSYVAGIQRDIVQLYRSAQ